MAGATKPKILLVDDSDALRSMFAEFLSDAGYEVLEARDGEEGLKEALRDGIDLVVLDRVLPKIDGLAVLKALRKSAHGKKLPVILLSGLTDGTDGLNALGDGADMVLSKPCLADDLEKAIRAFVSKP